MSIKDLIDALATNRKRLANPFAESVAVNSARSSSAALGEGLQLGPVGGLAPEREQL
jgi:hypothetical protein